MRDKVLWAIFTTLVALGGYAMIASVSTEITFRVGIALLIAAGIIVGIILRRRKSEQPQVKSERTLIKDTEVRAKAKHVKEATVMDLEGDVELSNVKASLEAEDVNKATVMKIKGSLNVIKTSCSKCGRQFSKVYTGKRLSEIKCPHCGHLNKVGGGE